MFVYFCIVNDIICSTVRCSSNAFYSRKAGAEDRRKRCRRPIIRMFNN